MAASVTTSAWAIPWLDLPSAMVKYIGAAYLIYLGVRLLLRKEQALTANPVVAQGVRRALFEGVAVEALNVKTALFFLAFLPQFVSVSEPLVPQLVLLGSVCVALNTLVDVVAVFAADHLLRSGVARAARARLMTRLSGVTMTRAYLRYMDWDIQLRISDENRPPFAPLVQAHNIAAEGVIFQDENVKVTAVEVPHGAAKPSYAFRFDTPTRSIVFSGDTSRSSSLVTLAKGADILVHEVLNTEGVDAAIGIGGAANEALKRHIIEAHTPVEEAGQVAHDAGVKKLVLTRFVPSLPAFDKPEIWIRGARKFYDGEIIVGQDLLEIE